MIKKIILISIFFLIFSNIKIYSQEIEKSQRWVCLNAVRNEDHSAEVSVDPQNKLLPNSDTYIFECLANNDIFQEICTSGNAELDEEVFKQRNVDIIKSMVEEYNSYSTLDSNPIKSDSNGMIKNFTWVTDTPGYYFSRRFLALNYFTAEKSTPAEGNDQTQKLSKFSFEEAINNSDCITISWDPYGRVFDSKTLEPISKAKVTLLVKRDNNQFTPITRQDILGGNIINPQTTLEDGYFNFVVPDGDYKLIVEAPNYNFPAKIEDINKNYKSIYSDIYPSTTGEIIYQRGKIQHRDIPINSNGQSQNNNPKIMEYFYNLDKKSSTIIIKGRSSHPFSLIKAYSIKYDSLSNTNIRNRLLTEKPIKTDKFGNFNIKISQIKFENNEFFGDLTVEKNNLNNEKEISSSLISFIKIFFNKFIKETNAQNISTSLRFEPILNYIEGYAYDENKKPIPNAEVYIFLNFSKDPYYKTQADEKGYFKIDSSFLPSMPYKIIFKDKFSKKEIKKTSSSFIKENYEFLNKNKVNLNKLKITEEKNSLNNLDNKNNIKQITNFIIPKNNKEKSQYFNNINNNQNNQKTTKNNQEKIKNNFFIIIIILFILILSSSLIIFYYLKNKKSF
ncbi:MAG: carboxypeptidase-like regulatory domain-containing protein [Patescibacteria group bacterium]|nr:carboxypeptidase-like regulatory domain-containing protein [Patescibacteria group bacterium]